jgi:hypothetical protein
MGKRNIIKRKKEENLACPHLRTTSLFFHSIEEYYYTNIIDIGAKMQARSRAPGWSDDTLIPISQQGYMVAL